MPPSPSPNPLRWGRPPPLVPGTGAEDAAHRQPRRLLLHGPAAAVDSGSRELLWRQGGAYHDVGGARSRRRPRQRLHAGPQGAAPCDKVGALGYTKKGK
uniref:Uncharacterized protein n=1 Tax=Tetraselmis sp. GSL018 TaxID=582737 RepID=A0A061RSZ6_9CHLO